MSNMDRKTALEVLKDFQEWRCNTEPTSPLLIDKELLDQAIDVAIHELERLCQEPPEKEYYGQ